jgi:hypothetical protein
MQYPVRVVNNYTSLSERAKAYVSVCDEQYQKGVILGSEWGKNATRKTPTRVRYSAKKIRVGTGHSTSKIWLDGILDTIARRSIIWLLDNWVNSRGPLIVLCII